MAKLFLESTDTRATVSDNNVSVYGASNDQVVVINGSLTGVVLDSNVERVQFTGSTTDYKYVQAGTDLKVYNATGDLVSTIGLQDDTTGTQLTFANGTVKAAIVAPTATAPMSFSIGGTAVTAVATTATPAPTPAAVTPATIDASLASALLPSFSVTGAASATEGSSALFTVTLANPSATTATTVKYTLTNLGGATNADTNDEVFAGTGVTGTLSTSTAVDGPYTGSLSFAPGATTATISLPVAFDSVVETGEAISLTLSLPSAGTVSSTGASVTTAFADAPAPTFTMTSSAVAGIATQEGKTITFTVTPSGIVAVQTVLNLNMVGSALGAIMATTSAADFTTASSLIFAAGDTAAKTVTVTVVSDGTTEGLEAYKAQLLDSSYNEKAAIQGTVTDATPTVTLTASATAVNEGAALTFTATSDIAAPAGGLVVPYTLGGTATAADYTNGAGSITIAAGATTGTLTLNAIADNLTEGAETVTVALGNVNGATTVTTPVSATINDTSLALAANAFSLSGAATANEGTSVVYTITRGAAATVATTVPYTITGTATSGADYTAQTGTATFAIGATTATITLPITADLLTETSETVIVTLGTPSVATDIVTAGQGTVTTTIADTSTTVVAVPFNLTTGVDAVPATANTVNGIIVGDTPLSTTLQVFDSITPAAGSTLNATLINKTADGTGIAVAGFSTTNVTTVNAQLVDTHTGASSTSWDLTGQTGLTAFNVKNSSVLNLTADTFTLNNFTKAVTLGVVGGSKYQNIMTAIVANDDNGTADQLNFALSGTAKAGTVTLAGSYEKLAIANSVDSTNAEVDSIALAGGKLQSLTVSGAGGVKTTIAASSFDSSTSVVKSIDASLASGKVDLAIADTLTDKFTSIKGGTGTTDKLTIVSASAPTLTSAVNISGFETVVNKVTGATYDATNFGTAVLGDAVVGSTVNAVTYSNIADGSTLLFEGQKSATDTAASTAGASIGATTNNITATVKNATSTALATALTVKINNQGTDLSTVTGSTTVAGITVGTVTANSVKALTIDAADANAVVTAITDSGLLTLNLKATKALTVSNTIGDATTTTSVDASTVVGKATLTLVPALAKDFTYTGSSAVDALSIGALTATTIANTVTVNTGTGNDLVTLTGAIGVDQILSSTLKLNLGDGDDTLAVVGGSFNAAVTTATTAKSHAIDFGAGTDTLTFGTTSADISGATLTGLEKIITSGTGILSVRASSVLGTSVTTGTELSIFSSGVGTVNLTAAPGTTGEAINASLAFLTNVASVTTVLNETGNEGADTITGSIGTDVIAGNGGADRIYGDNSGTGSVKAVYTDTITAAATGNVVGLNVFGINTSVTLDATTGASVTTAATALAAAINANTSLAGIVTATSSVGVVTVTALVDGAKVAVTSNTTAISTLADVTVGTSGLGGVDTITGGAGNDMIFGGNGADTITAGTGADVVVLNEGTTAIDKVAQGVADSIIASASVVTTGASTTFIDSLDTFTYGNGVDIITGFNANDTLDVVTAGTTYIDLNGWTAATVLVVGSHYYVQGTYTGGVFTVNTAATAATANYATLVIDGTGVTAANAVSQVVLVGVVATDLSTANFI